MKTTLEPVFVDVGGCLFLLSSIVAVVSNGEFTTSVYLASAASPVLVPHPVASVRAVIASAILEVRRQQGVSVESSVEPSVAD